VVIDFKVVQFSSHPLFKCPVPAENDHLKTRLDGYSDPHYIRAIIIIFILFMDPAKKQINFPHLV
jgi:hypothetical protein